MLLLAAASLLLPALLSAETVDRAGEVEEEKEVDGVTSSLENRNADDVGDTITVLTEHELRGLKSISVNMNTVVVLAGAHGLPGSKPIGGVAKDAASVPAGVRKLPGSKSTDGVNLDTALVPADPKPLGYTENIEISDSDSDGSKLADRIPRGYGFRDWTGLYDAAIVPRKRGHTAYTEDAEIPDSEDDPSAKKSGSERSGNESEIESAAKSGSKHFGDKPDSEHSEAN